MNSIALALVLFAAVLHASWNFVSKKSGGGSSFVLLYETFAFLVYMPLLYLVDFKRLLTLPVEMWLLIILSAVLHVIYTIVLQTGYRKADYSVVYPTARGTGPAFTVLVAVFLFGERLAPLGFAGIACVLLGIVLLALPGKDQELKSSLSQGLFWGVLTGVFIASYSSLDGFAIQLIGLTPLMYYVPGWQSDFCFSVRESFLRNPDGKALRKILRSAGNMLFTSASRTLPHTSWFCSLCFMHRLLMLLPPERFP